MRGTLIALLAASTAFAAVACGPSFQIIYEGDVRFEHCYAVDESSSTSMKEKAACWRDWMKNYTYGQTRDRIEYAAARHYALSIAPNAPTDEALMEAAPGGGVRKNVISAPMPSSANAPPPATMADAPDAGVAPKASGSPSPSPSSLVHPPGTECTDGCAKQWSGCREACAGKACDTCDVAHKACARACFGDATPGKPAPPAPKPTAPKKS